MNNYAVESIMKELTFELGETPFVFCCSANSKTGEVATASNIPLTDRIKFLQAMIKDLKDEIKSQVN